ncbi:MAG: glutaredoxin family protein [Methanotrichaceae archaeon]|nr:glutaredoxin family protein [Methanotrichaceae archaeon]
MTLIVYTTESCSKCEQLKRALGEQRIDYKVVNIATPEALTELRINGVFTLTAPVLQQDDVFLTVEDLFDGDNLRDLEALGIQ